MGEATKSHGRGRAVHVRKVPLVPHGYGAEPISDIVLEPDPTERRRCHQCGTVETVKGWRRNMFSPLNATTQNYLCAACRPARAAGNGLAASARRYCRVCGTAPHDGADQRCSKCRARQMESDPTGTVSEEPAESL